MKALRITCLIFPLIGFFVAISFWLLKKGERADELLFISFAGLLLNLVAIPILIFLIRMLLS
jgi:Na+-driven multidrug efflux pump